MEKQLTRRFSLEKDFMNYKTDDLLFGFMRSLSTARPLLDEKGKSVFNENKKQVYVEYLPKVEFVKNKKVIAGICGCSVKTIDRHLEALIASGLVKEGKEIIENERTNGNIDTYEISCYHFPYNEAERFKIVEKEMVSYLINTRNAQCIKVYLYLLNKYEWKPGYLFTIKEIQKALGYSGDTDSARTMVGHILESFSREGMISYEEIIDYEMRGEEVIAIPKKQLNFVAKSVKQLRKVD